MRTGRDTRRGCTPARRWRSWRRSSPIPSSNSFHYSFENVGQSVVRADDLGRTLELPLHLQRLAVHGRARRTTSNCSCACRSWSSLSVLVAAILYDRPFGWKVYRTILFVPYVLSIPMVGVVFGYLLEYNGNVNVLLRDAGLGGLAKDWLGTPGWALPTIMFVIIWKELGFGIVLCNARLSSADEAVLRGGARRWRRLVAVALARDAAAARAGARVLRRRRVHQHALVGLRLRVRDDARRPAEQHGRQRVLHLPAGVPEQRDRRRRRGGRHAARHRLRADRARASGPTRRSRAMATSEPRRRARPRVRRRRDDGSRSARWPGTRCCSRSPRSRSSRSTSWSRARSRRTTSSPATSSACPHHVVLSHAARGSSRAATSTAGC